MDIVYNCDDGYMKYTAVSICSLFENNRDVRELRVHILGNGISSESKDRAAKLAEGYGREISFYDLGDFESTVKALAGDSVDAGKFTVTALARLFAVKLLPKGIDRLLYLDCDTIVLQSLQKLWNTELHGNIAAMAAEPTIYPQVKLSIGLLEEEPYFNAGMILIDTEAWEANAVLERAMAYYKEHDGRLPFSDQDLINHVLRHKVLPVDQSYNFLSNYHYQSYRQLVRQAEWFKDCVSETEWKAAKASPAVVHFAGDERPWIKGSFNPYRQQFMSYKRLTPWHGEELIGGRRLYMLMYHAMNVITELFPSVRKLISDYYYKKFISD